MKDNRFKYLVRSNKWKKQVVDQKEITIGFLTINELNTIMVKIIDLKGYINVVSGNSEVSYEIPLAEAQRTLKDCLSKIFKTSYNVVHYVQTQKLEYMQTLSNYWEVDVYHRDNKGLVIASCGFASYEDRLILPNWVSDNITDDESYSLEGLIKLPYSLRKF